METEEVPDEAVVDNNDERSDRCTPAIKKIVGLIVAVVLVIVAQRDLRRRPAELVRGRVGVWKVVAMVGPGALAYLLFGRRRAAPTLVTPNLNNV
jgi:hypothetical protein